MIKFKLFLICLLVTAISGGFAFHEAKPIAEDLQYLDGFTKETITTTYIQ